MQLWDMQKDSWNDHGQKWELQSRKEKKKTSLMITSGYIA